MSVKVNQPTKLPREFNVVHFLAHCLTFVLVFAAGVGADVFIIHRLTHRPKQVRWAEGGMPLRGEFELAHIPTNQMPAQGTVIEFGFTEDGQMVWRTKGTK